jgi:hypothetical protein
VYIINCDRQSVQWLVSASQHNSITNQHNLTHNSKMTRLIKKSTISIRLTIHTEDKAVGMAVDDTTSVEDVYCFLLGFTGLFAQKKSLLE